MILRIPLNTIVSVTGASGEFEEQFVIERIASLETAGPQDLAVLLERGDASVFDAVSLDKIKNSKAGFILAGSPRVEGKRYLIVADVLGAYQKLIDFVQKKERANDFNVSSNQAMISQHASVDATAFVDAGAVVCTGVTIGEGSVIGAQVFLGKNCIIGRNVILHPGVKVLDGCSIGDGSIIHAGAVIGSDGFGYEVSRTGLRKIPQIGIVVIGKMVEIGANCTIDRASFDQTIIGDGVKLDNLVHIAHNVKVGSGTAILAHTGIAGQTTIGMGCQIGGQVAIKNDLVIGNSVKIVSKSGVMNNLKDGETVCGFPAVPFMQWKRTSVILNKLPEYSKIFTALKEQNYRSSWCAKIKGFFRRS